nr:Wzz/FepE/Etk N-terminal domain-containing protein [Listeria floridensis]
MWTMFKQKIIWILALILLGQACVYIYQNFIADTKYQANFGILLSNKENSNTASSQSEVQSNIQLLNTYSSVLTSEKILSDVKNEANVQLTTEAIAKKLTVTSDTNSLAFHFTYETTDKKEADKISQAYITVIQKDFPALFPNNTATILDQPTTAKVKLGFTNYILVFLITLLFSFISLLILCMKDRSIKTKEQLIDLGVTYIGDIPRIEEVHVKARGENS